LDRNFTLLTITVVVIGLFFGAFIASRTASTGPAIQSSSSAQAYGPSEQGASSRSGSAGAADSSQTQSSSPISGSVASLNGDILTVTTRQGDTKVKVTGAKIQKTVDGTADDLKAGETVVVTGEQDSSGSFVASTIQVRPSDAGSQTGFRGQRQGDSQAQSSGQNPARGQGQRIRALFGSVVSVEGDTLTLRSQQGETSQVKIPAARIEKTADGSTDDLKPGETVMITGERAADGTISATTILIRPSTSTGRPATTSSSQPAPTATPSKS